MELRAITDDEVPAFRECIVTTFGDDPGEADPDGDRRFRALVAPDQAWAMFDGATVVGTAASFELQVGMPGGGSLPCAGLTVVTVRPTHRRRGILTQLMAAYLADARERRHPVAALWASEATIYGRYGFGIGAWGDAIEVKDARGLAIAGASDTVEWIDDARARELLPAIYARATAQRPGALRRDDVWWRERRFLEAPFFAKGASKRRHVLAVRDGEPVGYVQYRQRGGFQGGLPGGRIEIVELLGIDARANASLWQYACAVDLFPTVAWWNAPVDDPVVHLVSDARRVTRSRTDTLWLRIEDPVRALAGRSFAGELRIAIGDEVLDIADYHCERSRGPAVVTIAPRALPALLLGGSRPSELAAAGLVTGDIAAADRVFAAPLAPWCAEIF